MTASDGCPGASPLLSGGSRACSSARTSLSSAIGMPCSAMTGNEHRIHTSERTREGRCAALSSSESSVRSNSLLDPQNRRAHDRIERQDLGGLVPLRRSVPATR